MKTVNLTLRFTPGTQCGTKPRLKFGRSERNRALSQCAFTCLPCRLTMQIDPDQPGILETGFESPKLLDGSPGNKVHRSRRHDICLLQNLLRLQYCFMLAAGGRNFHNMNALSFRTQSYKNTRTTTSLTRNYCTQNPAVQWYDPEGVRTSMVANHGRCCVFFRVVQHPTICRLQSSRWLVWDCPMHINKCTCFEQHHINNLCDAL